MLLTTDRSILFNVNCKLGSVIFGQVVLLRVTKYLQEISYKAGDSTNEGIILHKLDNRALSKLFSIAR